jgi:hypothetical protein
MLTVVGVMGGALGREKGLMGCGREDPEIELSCFY